jgi:hypothetical protein
MARKTKRRTCRACATKLRRSQAREQLQGARRFPAEPQRVTHPLNLLGATIAMSMRRNCGRVSTSKISSTAATRDEEDWGKQSWR